VRPILLIAPALGLLLATAPARAESPAEKFKTCLACHGESGQSSQPATPSLGGQRPLFALYQLVFFRGGQRTEQPMVDIVKGASDAELQAYADAIERLPAPKPPAEGRDAARFAAGKALAERLRCASCHGADFSGQQQMPRLASQRQDYLVHAMLTYKSGKRVGQLAMMPEIMRPLSEADIQALAHFFAYLP
jgi:cytochrome c553